jgi:hypothetical protein
MTPLNDTSIGQLICGRYIAPSAAVLLALAMTALAGRKGKAQIIGICLALFVTGGTIPYAADNKITWSSNLDLWTRTWQRGPHFKLAAVNLIEADMQSGKLNEALRISREWIETHPNDGQDNCRFVEAIAIADGSSKATKSLLKKFIPYAWCSPLLARKTATLLDTDRSLCPAVLRMAHRAADLGKVSKAPSPPDNQGTQDAEFTAKALADAENKCGIAKL